MWRPVSWSTTAIVEFGEQELKSWNAERAESRPLGYPTGQEIVNKDAQSVLGKLQGDGVNDDK